MSILCIANIDFNFITLNQEYFSTEEIIMYARIDQDIHEMSYCLDAIGYFV